jgi:hypothetical protein
MNPQDKIIKLLLFLHFSLTFLLSTVNKRKEEIKKVIMLLSVDRRPGTRTRRSRPTSRSHSPVDHLLFGVGP